MSARFVMKMPDVGEGVVEAEIVAWYAQRGDTVAEDQHIVDVMTNKATVEITSPVSGTVMERHGEAGDQLAVGAPLIEIETADDMHVGTSRSASALRSQSTANSGPAAQKKSISAAAQPQAMESASGVNTARRPPLAAPTVRRRASEAHVDLAVVPATGPGGRISHEDLDRFIAGARNTNTSVANTPMAALTPDTRPRAEETTGEGDSRIRIIGARRAIAEKMALSKRRIPHYTYVEEVDITELQALLDHLHAAGSAQLPRMSVLPFIMKALAKAVARFPHCNAHFDEEAGVLQQYAAVHIGVATNTSGGLRVPVVRDTQLLSVAQLASEVRRLAESARAGTITPAELSGSTITVTSLGKLGGIASTPVINHPEVAIVGINRAMERPVVMKGAIVVRTMLNLSASFDHRIVDGHDGASLIQAMKVLLEHPATLFMEA